MTLDIQKLKALAEHCQNVNGDAWYAEAFTAAANPAAVLELIAEIDSLKSCLDMESAELAWSDSDGRALSQELEKLKAENETLRKALLEASEDVAAWGAYASEYFQEKHDLAGCVAKLHAAAINKEHRP